MGGRLVEGNWVVRKTWEKESDGSFKRQQSIFRRRMEPTEPFLRDRPLSFVRVIGLSMGTSSPDGPGADGAGRGPSFSTVHPVMGDDGWV